MRMLTSPSDWPLEPLPMCDLAIKGKVLRLPFLSSYLGDLLVA